MRKDIYKHKNEKYAIFVGEKTPRFGPDMAGISYVDKTYEIQRLHGEFYVFEYIISGQGYVQQNEERHEVHAGDAYILTPGTYQHYGSDFQNPWTKVWFNVNGSLVRHLLSDYSLDTEFVFPSVGDGSKLFEIVETIERNPISSQDQVALLLLQHIQKLSSCLNANAEGNATAYAMKQYIEQHLAEPLSIDSLAEYVHLSRSRALHLYKDVYHTTPYRYYFSLKMELSLSLLSRTSMPISEIAKQLGFNDCQHFSSSFKKFYGVPPLQYRKTTQSDA